MAENSESLFRAWPKHALVPYLNPVESRLPSRSHLGRIAVRFGLYKISGPKRSTRSWIRTTIRSTL